jgi:hypothetical protein
LRDRTPGVRIGLKKPAEADYFVPKVKDYMDFNRQSAGNHRPVYPGHFRDTSPVLFSEG